MNHSAWDPFSIRKCRHLEVPVFFTSVSSTSWTPCGNAYPLLSWHFAPYHVISKIRVRKRNTGPITVLTLIDSYSLHQIPYESKGGTRRLQAMDSKNGGCWWRESNNDSSSDVYSVPSRNTVCTLPALRHRMRYCVTLCDLLRLFTVDRYDVCLGDNSSVHVSSVTLLWTIRKKLIFVFLCTGRSKSHLTIDV